MPNVKQKRSLGGGEKPEVKAKYAHMMAEDYAAWTAYLQSDYEDFDEVWYDVHVGVPMAVPPDSPNYMQAVVDGVSRKRIDVVGRWGNALYIIEVKPHANMTALGQALTYVHLFIEEFTIDGPVRAMIVATTCDADILDIAMRMNIKIVALKGVSL